MTQVIYTVQSLLETETQKTTKNNKAAKEHLSSCNGVQLTENAIN